MARDTKEVQCKYGIYGETTNHYNSTLLTK